MTSSTLIGFSISRLRPLWTFLINLQICFEQGSIRTRVTDQGDGEDRNWCKIPIFAAKSQKILKKHTFEQKIAFFHDLKLLEQMLTTFLKVDFKNAINSCCRVFDKWPNWNFWKSIGGSNPLWSPLQIEFFLAHLIPSKNKERENLIRDLVSYFSKNQRNKSCLI